MNTLPQTPAPVHSNPPFEVEDETFTPYTPFDGDEAWWDEVSRSAGDAPPAGDHTDLAWLLGQAEYHAVRECRGSVAGRQGFSLDGMLCCVLRRLTRSMRFHMLHRSTSAAEYARRRGIDLDAVMVFGVGSRRAPLAAALDVEASWYLHLDTAAGALAGYEILALADHAEMLGSATAEDYCVDEAAYRAAAMDAAEQSVEMS